MLIKLKASSTLIPVELHHGDDILFKLAGDGLAEITLLNTGACIKETTLSEPGKEEDGATTIYKFWAAIKINGKEVVLEREVGTQKSFYEPWIISGVMIWLDAVDAIFDFINETHGACRLNENCSHALPLRRHARLVIQDATMRICPEKILPWCPLPEGGLNIEECYRGEDCWMGAYDGASAHGGLDINHPKGTPLYAPFKLDDQFLYNSTAMGHNNNRWRGLRTWEDGSQWIIQSCHMVELTVAERQSISAGTHYAVGAGVWVGEHEHSHFAFTVVRDGELFHLDPWILFWQMYRDL